MRFGLVSVSTHPREASIARCRVNGVDVTHDCRAAHDVEGWADCYVRDADGRPIPIVEGGRIVGLERVRLTGDVVIDFPQGLD